MDEDPFEFLLWPVYLWKWKTCNIIFVIFTGTLQVLQMYIMFEVGLQHVSSLILFFLFFYGIICSCSLIINEKLILEIFEILQNALSFESMRGSAIKEMEKLIRYGKVYKRVVELLMLIICYALIPSENVYSEGYHLCVWIFRAYLPDFATILTIIYFCDLIVVAYLIISISLYVLYILFYLILKEKMVAYTIDRICDGLETGINLNNNLEYHKTVEARLYDCIRRIFWIRRTISKARKIVGKDLYVHVIGAVLVGMSLIVLFSIATRHNNRLSLLMISLPMAICFILLVVIASGQEVINQGEKIHGNLYECPWYTWNTKNKKTLLFLLNITEKPTAIYFTENVALNNVLLLSILKGVYTSAAVLRNL